MITEVFENLFTPNSTEVLKARSIEDIKQKARDVIEWYEEVGLSHAHHERAQLMVKFNEMIHDGYINADAYKPRRMNCLKDECDEALRMAKWVLEKL